MRRPSRRSSRRAKHVESPLVDLPVAGAADGASVWATEDSAQLIFPVRRGDARVFEIEPHSKMVPVHGPYGGMAEQEGGEPFVLSEFWLEGDDAPTVVVQ